MFGLSGFTLSDGIAAVGTVYSMGSDFGWWGGGKESQEADEEWRNYQRAQNEQARQDAIETHNRDIAYSWDVYDWQVANAEAQYGFQMQQFGYQKELYGLQADAALVWGEKQANEILKTGQENAEVYHDDAIATDAKRNEQRISDNYVQAKLFRTLDRTLATQITRYGKSGVATDSGSPLVVSEETVASATRDLRALKRMDDAHYNYYTKLIQKFMKLENMTLNRAIRTAQLVMDKASMDAEMALFMRDNLPEPVFMPPMAPGEPRPGTIDDIGKFAVAVAEQGQQQPQSTQTQSSDVQGAYVEGYDTAGLEKP